MRYLFNAVYLALLFAYLPVIWFQRIVTGKKRPGLWSKFLGHGPARELGQPRILFHAVSLGEVNAIRQLVNQFQTRHPEWEVVISTTTQTGLDAARRHFPEMEICLMPFDFTWATKRFLRNLNPNMIVLAELEIWPNLLRECREQSIPTCLVNARLSEKSHAKYSRMIRWTGNIFRYLDRVCCQNETYAKRFEALGVETNKTLVTGNLKYDSLLRDRGHSKILEFKDLAQIKDDDFVLIAGSTQAPEEKLVIDAYKQLKNDYPQVRLLICPRHPERFDEVADLLESSGIRNSRRSQLNDRDQSNMENCVERVVLLDCMGELTYWWGTGDVAFVGGSFGNRGGQNMIEPLAIGNAVSFGPNTRNFVHEVNGLKQYRAAQELRQPEDMVLFFQNCISNPEYRNRLLENGKIYLADHCMGIEGKEKNNTQQPAWGITLDAIKTLIGPKPEDSGVGSRIRAA